MSFLRFWRTLKCIETRDGRPAPPPRKKASLAPPRPAKIGKTCGAGRGKVYLNPLKIRPPDLVLDLLSRRKTKLALGVLAIKAVVKVLPNTIFGSGGFDSQISCHPALLSNRQELILIRINIKH